MVLRKKKIKKPPVKFEFEKTVKDLTVSDIRRYLKREIPFHAPVVKPFPLYTVAWGWNSNGRSGNITEQEIREPRQMQRSRRHRFISCASGMHHTLLLSYEGNIYATGDGRRDQLGFGNPITHKPKKGGIIQIYPRQVNPSGTYIQQRDFMISQISCGSTFSIGRELTPEEGVYLCPGLKELEQQLSHLKNIFHDSIPIQKVWAIIRQEIFKIQLNYRGNLVIWGTGRFGELGLGEQMRSINYPICIPKLRYLTITEVSAGRDHVLAITSTAQLYSWGHGGSGRLGHGDCISRDVPTLVEYLLPFYVKQCAAGDAHSAVITMTRKNFNPAHQRNRVACFGRGAFGRLGVGHVHNELIPVPVSQWFESIRPYEIRKVACGGAHTVIFASLYTGEKTGYNPSGVKTIVASWGFGGNGQLGTGEVGSSYIPVKSRIPKWEIVTDISAGRSWSMARTASGGLYTWGKGLRGQLGQQNKEFSLAPRKLDTFASFLRISSGYAHNVCIATSKKFLNEKVLEKSVLEGKDVFDNLANISLRNISPVYKNTFNCCRRNVSNDRFSQYRFSCRTCGIGSMCYLCSSLCHKGHIVTTNNAVGSKQLEFCSCGVSVKCKLLPTVTDVSVEDDDACEAIAASMSITIAVKKIQRCARVYIARVRRKRIIFLRTHVRREVCAQYFHTNIIGEVWRRMHEGFGRFLETRENIRMQIEDNARKWYDRHFRLQRALLTMDGLLKGIKILFGNSSIHVWVKDRYKATYVMSWRSLRYQQLRMHERDRLSIEHLVQMSSNYPRYEAHEGRYYDRDVCLLTSRFLKNETVLKGRDCNSYRALGAQIEIEARRLAKKSVGYAGSRLKNIKRTEYLARLKEKYEAFQTPVLDSIYSEDEDADADADIDVSKSGSKGGSSHIQGGGGGAKTAAENNSEISGIGGYFDDAISVDESKHNQEPSNIFAGTPMRDVVKRRRNSISSSEDMYNRVCQMRTNIIVRNYHRRRYSLPARIESLRCLSRPPFTYIASIEKSLDMFHSRLRLLHEWTDPFFEFIWLDVSEKEQRSKMKNTLGYSWLSPRLPPETLQQCLQPERRRTIAEPERLSRQLKVMFEGRVHFSKLRAKAREEHNMPVRQRSFDPGELYDNEDGVSSLLGFQYETPLTTPNLDDLQLDQFRLERKLVRSKGYMTFLATLKNGGDKLLLQKLKPPPPPPPPLPTSSNVIVVWQVHTSDEGHVYYYNTSTGESLWDAPQGKHVQLQYMYQDYTSGAWYWYNETTGDTSWV